MKRSPIIFYSILFAIINASFILRNVDDDECKHIPNCDECDEDTHQCTECDDGFYLNSIKSCERCSQQNCEECPNDKCIKCHDHNILIGNECQSHEMIPKAKRMKKCEQYDLDFTCLRCDDDCSMRNGMCLCDKDDDDDENNHTTVIVVSIVVSIAVIIGFIIGGRFLYLYMKNRKQAPIEERNVNINLPNIPGSDDVNYNMMNEKGETVKPSNTIGNDNLIESQRIEIKRTNTNERHLCMKCNKETAIYKLSCGCYLCKDDISENSNESINAKCPVCNRNVDKVKKIMYECGVCLELNEKTNRFDCGCKFEICDKCAEKIIKNKQCPGCRKEIKNIIQIKD